MTTEQIYGIVNSVNDQAFGAESLTVVDTSSLISLGDTVLSSSTNTEAFLNTLAQRIGRTILSFREYRNKLGDMVLNDFEYGAILQKIKVVMPEAEADDMYELTNGESVDMYKVSKPEVKQKLFVTRTPYQFKITIQRETLKEAFLGEIEMGAFIGVVFGEVRNAIEVSLENLSRVTLATAICECAYDGGHREVPLVSWYNDEFSKSLTAQTALTDPDFLRFAIREINTKIDSFQDMNELYNDGTVKRFTPKEDMRIRIISPFVRALETQVEYAAFHDEFVKIDGAYSVLNYWQSAESPYDAKIVIPSIDDEVTASNVVCLLADRDAMGIYQIEEEVGTSPLNVAGMYYNTFWHSRQLRFLDKSEQFICFTLN